MPLKTEPGGQEVNMNPDENTTTPPPDQGTATDAVDQQVFPATPPVEPNATPPEEQNTPGPTTDQVAGPVAEATDPKEARIQQLIAAGFVQDGEYYDKPGTEFAVHADNIMNDSDEDWATHIAAIETFDSTPAPAPEVEPQPEPDQTPAADPTPQPEVDPTPAPAVEPAPEVDALAPVEPAADPSVTPDAEVAPDAPVDETPAVPPFDYTNKIRLSQNDADAVDKDVALEAVQTSSVLPYYKQILVDMITNDALDGLYADYLRRIFNAHGAGGSYAGTL